MGLAEEMLQPLLMTTGRMKRRRQLQAMTIPRCRFDLESVGPRELPRNQQKTIARHRRPWPAAEEPRRARPSANGMTQLGLRLEQGNERRTMLACLPEPLVWVSDAILHDTTAGTAQSHGDISGFSLIYVTAVLGHGVNALASVARYMLGSTKHRANARTSCIACLIVMNLTDHETAMHGESQASCLGCCNADIVFSKSAAFRANV